MSSRTLSATTIVERLISPAFRRSATAYRDSGPRCPSPIIATGPPSRTTVRSEE